MFRSFIKLGALRLVILQVLAYAALIIMIKNASYIHWIVSIVVYFFTGCIGMAITAHRWMSHKSFNPPRWFQIFGLFCGTLGGLSPLVWTAVHRQHHKFGDRNGDPHSPVVNGLIFVQFKTMLSNPKWRYVRDLLNDPVQRFFFKNHWKIQIFYALFLLAIDPFAIVYCYLVPTAFLWNIGAALNFVCHKYGYRNYDSKDHSTNNPVMALLMWGEGWHNNHHAHPNLWYCGHFWYEFDVCSWIIRLVDPSVQAQKNGYR